MFEHCKEEQTVSTPDVLKMPKLKKFLEINLTDTVLMAFREHCSGNFIDVQLNLSKINMAIMSFNIYWKEVDQVISPWLFQRFTDRCFNSANTSLQVTLLKNASIMAIEKNVSNLSKKFCKSDLTGKVWIF
jgi:hypothetical protein